MTDISTPMLDRALRGADETRDILFGDGVLQATGQFFADLFPETAAFVVADANTYQAAGQQVVASLTAAGVTQVHDPFIFPGAPTLYADYDNVEFLRERIRPFPATVVVSVGSGTLGDIAKLAVGELGRPYLHVCTAASVDGYASFGASIARSGFKITRACPAPAGLVADIEVVASAPARLTATGYGDLIEKIPAGADWLLADALRVEPIDAGVWDLVQQPLRDSLSDPAAIGRGDKQAIAGLMKGHLMSGLAMQAAKSSRPASGAGHQFSHTWEMEGHGLDWEPPLSHGFKVGIGTIASCALWEVFLGFEDVDFSMERSLASVRTPEQIEAQVRAELEPRMQDEALRHSLAKRTTGDELVTRVELLKQQWPSLRNRCRAQLLPPDEVMQRLKTVGAPHHPELIGIDWERFRRTYLRARLIRDRYTVLDILTDLGLFDQVVDTLFSPTGFWGQHRHPE